MRAVILVEGATDELALSLTAARLGRDLAAEGTTVLPINGAHAIGRFLRRLPGEHPGAVVAGLYDAGEEDVIRGALLRAGFGIVDGARLEGVGFFACVTDLEDELTRAAGEAVLLALIEQEGDAVPWQTFRRQQAWERRPVDQQFRRFIRSISERNSRYIRAILETIDTSRLPGPLVGLLEYVRP